MIHLEDVRFAYTGKEGAGFLLSVDDLRLGRGELAACIGPSGCGKTTLVSLIAGILTPDSGRIAVGGTEVSSLSDAERRRFRAERIGMVFQEFELLEYLSAMDNMLLPFLLRTGRVSSDAKGVARAIAHRLSIDHVLKRSPRRLSQGERQRVSIGRALVTGPGLILCDEPTGNLDPVATRTTLDLLLSQSLQTGATLLMVTHNHTLLSRFDRVIDLGATSSTLQDDRMAVPG
ncbi:MAG: ATP-binding cassette domain-containing protein [Pyrinomonadaceae bacterium]|nr:ATP-binding cassette domain-containing protein [Phycisphaerales bacterium]